MVLLDEPDAGASRCSGRCRRRVKLVEDEGITSPQVVLLKAIDPLWAWQETTRASKPGQEGQTFFWKSRRLLTVT